MTRFLSFDFLRANEAPFWTDGESGRVHRRPALVAAWHIAPDGQPVCRWQIDDDTDPEG